MEIKRFGLRLLALGAGLAVCGAVSAQSAFPTKPLKLIIDNYPEGQVEELDAEQPGETWPAQLFQGGREIGTILREWRHLGHEPGTLPTAPIG